MNRCPITYEPLAEGVNYSLAGLRLLDRSLKTLAPLALTAEEQRREAIRRTGKMSVQGVQPKLSAVLRIKQGQFDIVDSGGRFILKPPSLDYPELPANEDVTMRMAAVAGIEVPLHGLLNAVDGSLTYFIKRFDRAGRQRLPQEDFAQLTGGSRDTKYNSSMEKVARVIEQHCTFPMLELQKLFERTLFSFLSGNEDMHLKNFSLLTRGGKVELAPAYDFLNTTIALANAREELALPVRGKKSNLTRNDFLRYFASEQLGLSEALIDDTITRFRQAAPKWRELLEQSFLSPTMRQRFLSLLEDRTQRCLGMD